MVLEGSDVPLEKSIIEVKKEFAPTWLEWAADNLEIISAANFSQRDITGGTTVNLFTVPKNKTLFITSAWLSANNPIGTGGRLDCLLALSDPNRNLLNFNFDIDSPTSMSSTHNFTMPIKVEQNSIVRFTNSGIVIPANSSNCHVTAGFLGFLVSKRVG